MYYTYDGEFLKFYRVMCGIYVITNIIRESHIVILCNYAGEAKVKLICCVHIFKLNGPSETSGSEKIN